MERAMRSVASSLVPPRGLSPRRSDGDLASTASDVGTPLKPTKSNSETTEALRLAHMTPCFFHRRFQDSINIEKVIEEIAADETMSHSKLVQAAVGVREISKQLQRRPIKRAARTIMIVTKARDNDLVYKTREVAEWLMRTPRYGAGIGVTVYVDNKLRNSRRFDAAGLVASDPRFDSLLKYWTPDTCWSTPEKFDLVLTLGGDGTVLFTSWLFQRIVPPILSFSLGSLGFLTPFDFARHREHLDRVMGGHSPLSSGFSSGFSTLLSTSIPTLPPDTAADAGMRVNMRMRFTCTVFRAPRNSRGPVAAAEESSKFEVLNELVIDRGPSPYVSNLELFGDDEPLTVIQADGVIFSTPTGSTAYSLSAGGSLVHPDIPAILLTPICPHTLSFRPMLLNDTMALRIAVPRASRATAYCSFDGKGRIELRQGDYVTIAASQYPFPTVLGSKMEWIDSVSRTLRWNTREAQQKGWGSSGNAVPRRTASTAAKGGAAMQGGRRVSGDETPLRAIPSRQDSGSQFDVLEMRRGRGDSGVSQAVREFPTPPPPPPSQVIADRVGAFSLEAVEAEAEGEVEGEDGDGQDDQDFDIDIGDDDMDGPLDSRDSGYEGDACSCASERGEKERERGWSGGGGGGGGGRDGTASPARRGLSLLHMS